MEFPECMKRRGGPEMGGAYGEHQMNGQRCHRIAGHDAYSDCLFDRAPEFDPVREEVRPMPKGIRWHEGVLVPVAR
jgi:hypothetical protein